MVQIAPPCDRGLAAAAAEDKPSPVRVRGAFVLGGTVLGSSLAFIDGSAVNLALPVIQQTLGGDTAAAQWIMNAYLLMLGALVLAGGAAADRYGRRRVFVLGVAVFTLGSLACGLAPGLGLLIAARASQGVGAAMLTPASLAILGAAFDDKARGQAVGVWAGAAGVASAVGPVLGGWLVQAVSWRAVFLINLPVATVAIWLIMVGAPETRSKRSGPVDWAGAAAVTLGLGGATWGLTSAPSLGFGDPAVLAALILAAAALAGFVEIERRAANPMLPLQLFRSATFSGANALTLFLYAAFGGALFLLPFNLIRAHGYPPAEAGAALLPLSVGLAVLSPLAGRLSHLVGARTLLTTGSWIVAVGFGWLAATTSTGAYWTGPFPGLALLALGMGLAVAPLTDAVLGAVDPAYEGAAAGINNAVARVAGMIAVALLGFVLVSPDAGGGALDASAAGRQALQDGYRAAMIAAGLLAAAAGLVAAVAIRIPASKRPAGERA
jgi:EmrB/QacA subfamily drug resistance transporter